MAEQRTYDVVLFGATGYTGRLTAQYLASHAPPNARWALAGRNFNKLAALRASLAAMEPRLADLELLEADVERPDSLMAIARATRVVITTVGPYIRFGEGLVAACAAAGTDYVDLTGEPEFVDRMWLQYHERACNSGARIVHCCGFDSIPHDLGVLYTVLQLPASVPLRIEGQVRVSGRFSSGTYHSAIIAFSRMRHYAAVQRERRTREARPEDRIIGTLHAGLHHADDGGWLLPLPTIDAQVVKRSAAAFDRYGPDFRYGHYLHLSRLSQAVGIAVGVGTALGFAQFAPMRNWMLRKYEPGQGPTAEQRERAWFKVRFIGSGGGRRVVTQVSGGDPGYSETAKMLAESALCLAFDELPARAGQLTPATAMGESLIKRLQRAGIGFEVIDKS